MGGNGSPALLITLDCLGRSPQQICHLRLRFAKPGSQGVKLVFVHRTGLYHIVACAIKNRG